MLPVYQNSHHVPSIIISSPASAQLTGKDFKEQHVGKDHKEQHGGKDPKEQHAGKDPKVQHVWKDPKDQHRHPRDEQQLNHLRVEKTLINCTTVMYPQHGGSPRFFPNQAHIASPAAMRVMLNG